MAPRARKISCKDGLVRFSIGITEGQIEEFLKANNITREPNSSQYVTAMSDVTIRVPPKDEYLVPDDLWIWVII